MLIDIFLHLFISPRFLSSSLQDTEKCNQHEIWKLDLQTVINFIHLSQTATTNFIET